MKIKVSVSTGFVGSKREEIIDVPDDELDDLTDEEIDEVLDRIAKQWLWDHINWGWDRVAQ